MPRQFVNTLSDGMSVSETYLLVDKQLRANRHAELYLLAQLRDRTGQISGLLWNVAEDSTNHISSGDYVNIRGKVQLFQNNLQIILSHISPASELNINPDDFVMTPGIDVQQLYGRLWDILGGLRTEPLRQLFDLFRRDPEIEQGMQAAPAGVRMHHAYPGGLLEHTVNILETALRISDLYPQINLDLLLAGIFLHDLGKVRELTYDTAMGYSDEGQLIGHIVIGVEMLDEKLREFEEIGGLPFPNDLALRLKHMILSHHGTTEFGSPKVPMTPEAIALHHLETLDAKVNEFSGLIAADPNTDSRWTPFHTSIGRRLFKGDRET
jgi:3'-5' exoribonuclease